MDHAQVRGESGITAAVTGGIYSNVLIHAARIRTFLEIRLGSGIHVRTHVRAIEHKRGTDRPYLSEIQVKLYSACLIHLVVQRFHVTEHDIGRV